MPHRVFVAAKAEFEFDGLLKTLEAPVSLLLFERRHTQEFIHGLFRVFGFQLFGIVVFVFNVDISTLFFVIIFVFKVVP